MRETETLPFYKKIRSSSDRNFFVPKSENTLISYLDLRKMRITDQLQIFLQEKSENSTFSYLDHQNREMEVQEMNDKTIE